MTVAGQPAPPRDVRSVEEFRTTRAPAWAELNALVNGRTRRRSAAQVMLLSRLHREAVADLALARRRWPGEPVVDALENLVAASHAALFAPGTADVRRLGAWLQRGFWNALRSNMSWAAASFALLVVFALLGAAWVAADPDAGARVVPVDLRRDIAVGPWRAPIGPLAAAAAFAAGAAALVPLGLVLAWVGLELGGAVAVALDIGDRADAFTAVGAAFPLLTAMCFAAAAGAGAGAAVPRGRTEWTKQVAVGAQVVATLVPLLVLGAVLRDNAASPAYASAGIALAALLWSFALRRGRAT